MVASTTNAEIVAPYLEVENDELRLLYRVIPLLCSLFALIRLKVVVVVEIDEFPSLHVAILLLFPLPIDLSFSILNV